MINNFRKIVKYVISFTLMFAILFAGINISEAADNKLQLNLVEETDLYIKFTWEGIDTISNFAELAIMVGESESDFKEFATISNSEVDYFLMNRPFPGELSNEDTGIRYYKIVARTTSARTYESNVKVYNPELLNLKPSVPELKKENMIFDPATKTLTLKWDPFIYDNNGSEIAVMDPERIKYDMLVTNDVAVLNSYDQIELNETYNERCIIHDATPVETEDGDLYWTVDVTRGVAFDRVGYKTENALLTNTVYYIRLIAKMDSNTTTLKSDPSITAFYITNEGVLTVPAVMPKPPLKVKDTTINSVTLSWNMEWSEITDNNTNSSTSWTNRLWIYDKGSGNYDTYLSEAKYLASGHTLEDENLIIYDLSNDIENEKYNNLPRYKIDATNGMDYFLRNVKYTPAFNYEITHMRETEVQNLLGQLKQSGKYDDPDAALLDIINDEEKLKKEKIKLTWVSYSYDDLMKDENSINVSALYNNGLTSNTPYRFFIRAYRIDDNGEKIYATRPSSVAATTKLDQEFVEPTPTVPTLITVETLDISAKIKWRYNSELCYDLKISESDDINSAETINITNAMLKDPNAEIEDSYYFVHQLKELYPETRYYVWIQAKQVVGNVQSAWSNPLTFKTSAILPQPLTPPSGIGVASEKDAITQDHITVEWTRKEEDYELDDYHGTKILKNLSYVCEVANNIKFFDSQTVECGGLDNSQGNAGDFIVYSKSEFRVINLKSNARYYVRIKTRVTVRDTANSRECYVDSPWSIIKIFKTTSVNEYDSEYGDIDIPLAEKTEKIYSGNGVRINILNDDRVINDMIEQGTFDYTFDFSNELSKYNTREAYLPVNVLETMVNRDMSIILKSKDMTYNVPAKAFKNMDFANLQRQGGVKGLVLTLNDDNSIYPTSVLSKEIGAYFTTKYGDSATTYLEDYINVLFDTRDAVFSSKNKAKGVVYDTKTKTWKDADSYTLGYNLIVKTGKTGKVGISY